MDEQEKFDLIINAIQDARKGQTGPIIELPIDLNHKLHGISSYAIRDILERSLNQKGVLGVLDPYRNATSSGPKIPSMGGHVSSASGESKTLLDTPKKPHLRILIHEGFDNWYEGYVLSKQDDLGSLSLLNLAKIYCTVLDIDEKLQVNPSPTVKIDLSFRNRSFGLGENFNSYEYRNDALNYLRNKGVINGFKIHSSEYGSSVDVAVNLSRFREFRPKVAKLHQAKEKALEDEAFEQTLKESRQPSGNGNPAPQDSDIVYEVRYADQERTITVNGFPLAKPNFDSENDNVFNYLFRNPNRKIGREELEKECLGGSPLRKDLHKIVENLGFTGSLRKLFFEVSKASIHFRNPIRIKELKDMGIDWLRSPR